MIYMFKIRHQMFQQFALQIIRNHRPHTQVIGLAQLRLTPAHFRRSSKGQIREFFQQSPIHCEQLLFHLWNTSCKLVRRSRDCRRGGR